MKTSIPLPSPLSSSFSENLSPIRKNWAFVRCRLSSRIVVSPKRGLGPSWNMGSFLSSDQNSTLDLNKKRLIDKYYFEFLVFFSSLFFFVWFDHVKKYNDQIHFLFAIWLSHKEFSFAEISDPQMKFCQREKIQNPQITFWTHTFHEFWVTCFDIPLCV